MTTTVNSAFTTRPSLPPLPLEEWEQTKETLHLWVQIVGKIRMATSPPRNHWWHVPLYVDVRGLTTRRLHAPDGTTLPDRLRLRRSPDPRSHEPWRGGIVRPRPRSVGRCVRRAAARDASRSWRRRRDSRDAVRRSDHDAVPQDVDHAAYDPHAVERFWRILDWTDGVFETFSGLVLRQDEPVHLFWHSLDLAVTRFDGGRSPDQPVAAPSTGRRTRTTSSRSASGRATANVREPTYYAYAAPEPEGLRQQTLRPDEARWVERAGGSLALLPYEAVRTAPDPRRALLAFLESAYQAGAALGGWDRRELTSSWCPPPRELHDLVGG